MNKIKIIISFLILVSISSCTSQPSNNSGLFSISNSITKLSESVEALANKKENISINTNNDLIHIKNADLYCRSTSLRDIIVKKSDIKSIEESEKKRTIYIKMNNSNEKHCLSGNLDNWNKHFKIIK